MNPTPGDYHEPVRRLLACFALVAVLVPGAAAAAHAGSAQARDPEDQARARAMLLRKSDLLPGFVARGGASGDDNLTGLQCPGIETAGVQPTGNVSSPNFSRAPIFVSSHATLFGTAAEAGAVWSDFGSKAGRECLVKILRRAFVGDGTLVSFRKTSFPRVGQRTLSFRVVAKVRGIPAYLDWVMVKHSRAIAIVLAGGATTAVTREYVLALTRIVHGRMKTAMRGA
jgi:hypothetical protein